MLGDAPKLIGRSRVMRHVNERIELLAPTNEWIWIVGETGTGKGLVARLIHALSGRRGRFVELNSERLRSSLVESTVYGHAKWTFTGAETDKKGRYEQAAAGTLFLCEGGRTRRRGQGLLLEVFDDNGFSPMGDDRVIKPDVRVLFASSREPASLLEDGTFDEHFFFRLGALYIYLPPLRDHLEDIEDLLEHYFHARASSRGLPARPWDDAALETLSRYGWPGNVRQFLTVASACNALAGRSSVTSGIVVEILSHQPGWRTRKPGISAADHIEEALTALHGNITATARHLGICENTVRRTLNKRGLRANDFRYPEGEPPGSAVPV